MGFICLAGFLVLVGACLWAYAGEDLGDEDWRSGCCLAAFLLLTGGCLYTYVCTGSMAATVQQLGSWIDKAKVFAAGVTAVLVGADVALKALKAALITSSNTNSSGHGTDATSQ